MYLHPNKPNKLQKDKTVPGRIELHDKTQPKNVISEQEDFLVDWIE